MSMQYKCKATATSKMYDHVQYFYAEVWMRACCSALATSMADEILSWREPPTPARLASFEQQYMHHIDAAIQKRHEKAKLRMEPLRNDVATRKALGKLYQRYMVDTATSTDGHVTEQRLRFFKIVQGKLWTRNAANGAALMALWQQYPRIDENLRKTWMLRMLAGAARRMRRYFNTDPHTAWKDTAAWSSLMALVQQSPFIHARTRAPILQEIQRLMDDAVAMTQMSFFFCDATDCKACQDYENFLACLVRR